MGTGHINTYRALASSSRVEILHVLQEQGELPLDDIARAVRLHHNTVREHLDRLIDAGFVDRKPEHRGTRGRPRMLYKEAAAPGHKSLDSNFRDHFMRILVAGYGTEMESPAAAAQRAGTQWVTKALVASHPGTEQPDDDGARSGAAGKPATTAASVGEAGLRQLAALEVHLDELGLAPEVEVDELTVHLRRCPFIDLARERTEVVCSVHLGVARGILDHEGGPLVAERLDPMVAPSHCILHLARRDEGSAAANDERQVE